MPNRHIGLAIMVIGVVVVLVGVLVWSGVLNWFGKMPGDFRYEGDKTKVYFPFVSMILISALLSLILYLLRRFL